MKKWILRLLALVTVLVFGTIVWFAMTFRTQYEAAESIHLVEKGMYEYYYEGDTGLDQFLEQGGAAKSIDIVAYATEFLTHGLVGLNIEESKFGCSVVNATDNQGGLLTARNFDWFSDQHSDLVIIHTHPNVGYASVATFYIRFFGFGENYKPESMAQKFMLLGSLYVALDGMNEKGLVVADLVAGDNEETNQKGGESNLTTTLAIRLLLDRAADVEEALALLRRYNMHSDINLAHHLAISDAQGRSVVVEWADNQMYVVESPVCTNHYLAAEPKLETQEINPNSQERYDALQAQISAKPIMTPQDITNTLASVSGPDYTRWSIIYDRQNLTATYYQDADFTKPYVTTIGR